MGTIIDPSEVLLEMGLSASVTEEERAIVNTAIVRAEGAIKRYLKYDPVQCERTEYYPQQEFDHNSREGLWEVQGGLAVIRRVTEASTSELQVKHVPIRSITSLRVDLDGRSGTTLGSFPLETERIEGSDFWANYDGLDSSDVQICRDGIIRSFGLWPVTPGTVRLIYIAGYTSAEIHGQDTLVDASPIMDATLQEAVRRAQKAFLMMKSSRGFVAGPLTGERMGDYSYTLASSTSQQLFGGSYDVIPSSVEKLSDFVNWGWAM